MVLGIVMWIFAAFAFVLVYMKAKEEKEEFKVKNRHGDKAAPMSVLSGAYSARHTEIRNSTHKMPKQVLLAMGIFCTGLGVYFATWHVVFLWITIAATAGYIIWEIVKRVMKWAERRKKLKQRF